MNDTVPRQSFPILGLLGLLFVGLKLTGYITWSWWWVTLPFWGPFALFVAIVVLMLLGSGFCLIFDSAIK